MCNVGPHCYGTISKEVILKTFRLFPKKCNKGVGIYFLFERKIDLFTTSYFFFPFGYKVCIDWFGKS